MSEGQITASGIGTNHPSAPADGGSSYFGVTFQVIDPVEISLTGAVDGDGGQPAAYVNLSQTGVGTLFGASDGPFTFESQIEPGTYELRARVGGWDNFGDHMDQTFDFQADFVEVPPPIPSVVAVGGLMLVTGLLALGVRGLRASIHAPTSRNVEAAIALRAGE